MCTKNYWLTLFAIISTSFSVASERIVTISDEPTLRKLIEQYPHYDYEDFKRLVVVTFANKRMSLTELITAVNYTKTFSLENQLVHIPTDDPFSAGIKMVSVPRADFILARAIPEIYSVLFNNDAQLMQEKDLTLNELNKNLSFNSRYE